MELFTFFSHNLHRTDLESFVTMNPHPFILIDLFEPVAVEMETTTSQESDTPTVFDLKVPKELQLPFASINAQIKPMIFDEGQVQYTFGRDPRSDLVLEHHKISRTHAAIKPGPDKDWLLGDLESSNGTMIGEVAVPPKEFIPLPYAEPFYLAKLVKLQLLPPETVFTYAKRVREEWDSLFNHNKSQ